MTKYFGAHGTLEGYAPGLYVVEANSAGEAYRKLNRRLPYLKVFLNLPRTGSHIADDFQEIKGEWAKVLSDTLDQIRNREKEYYKDLGSGVFYVEV